LVHFVVGICNDKDYTKMLDDLLNFPNARLYLTETTEKVLDVRMYGEKFLGAAICATANQLEALDIAVDAATSDDLVVVTGTLSQEGYERRRITSV
jgi:folylpolyglutamate synthase/dihydropteroate synthase